MHNHEEDEHVALMSRHEHNSQHHCELDDHFCQPGLSDHCEHTSHIQKTLTRCFSCHFHFVTPVDITPYGLSTFLAELGITYSSPEEQVYSGSTVLLLNKGPPAFPVHG